MIAMRHPQEDARVQALCAFDILDTPPESQYDDLTHLAAKICEAPIALVSLVDPNRQWFKSRYGLDACETNRDVAFCTHAILQDDLFTVTNALEDDRFRDNPLVTGEPHIRFYSGMPLTTPEGHNIGTLCVIDRVARILHEKQQEALRVLARQVVAQLLLRRQLSALEVAYSQKRQAEAELRVSDQRFRAFMDNSPAVAFMKDANGQFVYVNQPLINRFGIPQERWIGHTDADLHHADVARELMAVDRRILESGRTETLYEHMPTPDGESFEWEVFKFRLCDADGKPYIGGMAVDRTQRKKSEDALRHSEERFRNTVDRLAEGVFLIDIGTGTFVDANLAVLDMLGYTMDEFRTLDPYGLMVNESPEIYAQNVEDMKHALKQHGRYEVGRKLLRRKDGTACHVNLRITVVPNDGAGLHAVIVRDVSEQHEYENRLYEYQNELEAANAKLKALATTDALTGVKNRAAFNDTLSDEFERFRRHGRLLSLIMIDVDHFKLFNDTFGHPAGDRVLRTVAQLLQAAIRSTDTLARYGGEEFVIILPDTDYAGAMVLAERCRRSVACAIWDQRIITISAGVTTCTPTISQPSQLVQDADQALYRSKQAGRNRVHHGSGTIGSAAVVRRMPTAVALTSN